MVQSRDGSADDFASPGVITKWDNRIGLGDRARPRARPRSPTSRCSCARGDGAEDDGYVLAYRLRPQPRLERPRDPRRVRHRRRAARGRPPPPPRAARLPRQLHPRLTRLVLWRERVVGTQIRQENPLAATSAGERLGSLPRREVGTLHEPRRRKRQPAERERRGDGMRGASRASPNHAPSNPLRTGRPRSARMASR